MVTETEPPETNGMVELVYLNDLDGVLNLHEFGLGGDPINAADQGTSPGFEIVNNGGSNVFNYVHPQRSDPDSGLTYSLALRQTSSPEAGRPMPDT